MVTRSVEKTGSWLAAMNLKLWYSALLIGIVGTVFSSVAQEPMPSTPVGAQGVGNTNGNPPSVDGLGQMPKEGQPEVLGTGLLPDLMLMRNERGEQVLVPRTTYEDFERRFMEYQFGDSGRGGAPNLTQLDLTIEPMGDYAKVQAKTSLVLKQPNQVLWEVPLGLGQLQWLPSHGPIAEGIDGSASLALVSRGNGYVWRLLPNRGVDRKFVADALCKLVTSQTSASMRLELPSAATVVKLKLPKGKWDLSATGGGNEVVEPFQEQDDHSVAIVRTSSSSLNLVWSRKLERETTAAIEVRSDTKFSPNNDASQWRAVSTFSIRGPWKLGGKRFKWQLPPHSTLRETNPTATAFPNYRIVREPLEADGSSPALTQAVQAVPDSTEQKSSKPESWWIEIDEGFSRTELELAIEWTTLKSETDTSVQFGTMFFDGIDRHSGVLDVIIPRSISLDWKPEGGAQLLRQSQAGDGSESLVYTFQFESQPASIAAQWATITEQPKMLADIQVEVRETQLVMRGVWAFRSDPIQLPLMQFEINGWKLERMMLHPSEVSVPISSAVAGAEGRSSLPISANLWIRSSASPRINESGDSNRVDKSLESSGASGGTRSAVDFSNGILTGGNGDSLEGANWRMEFVLTRTLKSEENELSINLPTLSWLSQDTQQRVERSVPGKLLFFAWPYRLETRVDGSSSLVAIPPDRSLGRGPTERWGSGMVPYFLQYLISDGSEAAKWAGTRMRKGVFVTADVAASMHVKKMNTEWSVLWNARAFGSRPESLIVRFPISNSSIAGGTTLDNVPSIAKMESPEFYLDGNRCETTWQELPEKQGLQERRERVAQVQLPPLSPDGENRMDFLFECRFQTDSSLLNFDSERATLMLELPSVGTEKAQERWVIDSANMRLQADADLGWHFLEDNFDGIVAMDPISLRREVQLHRTIDSNGENVHIEGEWIQTIVNALDQRDRYVVRFETEATSIKVRIDDALKRDADWILNGQRIANRVELDEPGVAIVMLPEENTNQQESVTGSKRNFVLEVFLSERAPRGWWRSVKPLGTRAVGSTVPSALVWQVLVPRTEYLVWNSQSLFPVYQWRWQDVLFRRVGSFSQSDLERRFGATEQPVVSPQVNQYDMTSLAYDADLQATFLPSALVWLPASLFVLGLTVLLKDQRWLRKPWLWGAFLCLFFLFSQLALDVSLLVFQAALAAVALAVFYSLIRWVLDRRARRRSVFVSRQYNPAPAANSKTSIGKRNVPSSVILRSTVAAEGKENP